MSSNSEAGGDNQKGNSTTEGTESKSGKPKPFKPRYRGKGGKQKYQPVMKSSSVDFKGQTSDINGVLALMNETVTAKKPYEDFKEGLSLYCSTNLDYGVDLQPLIMKGVDPKPEMVAEFDPGDPTDEQINNPGKKYRYEKRLSAFLDREEQLADNIKVLYQLIWNQCTPALQAHLKSFDNFDEKHRKQDAQWLIKTVKQAMAGISSRGNKWFTLIKVVRALLNFKQKPNEDTEDYSNRFGDAIDNVRLVGGENFLRSVQLAGDKKKDTATPAELAVAEEEFLSALMIMCADDGRYSILKAKLEDGACLGDDKIPTDKQAAYDALNNHSTDVEHKSLTLKSGNGGGNGSGKPRGNGHHSIDVQMVQQKAKGNGNPVPGSDGILHDRITCYACGKKGHYSFACPTVDDDQESNGKSGVGCTQMGYALRQRGDPMINPSWILLDSCSTSSTFHDKSLVSNIHKCASADELHLYSSGGGYSVFDQKGLCNFLPTEVYYSEDSIANIFSLKDVANIPGVTVTMDTSKARAMYVHYNGTTFPFLECGDGLYYFDTDDDKTLTKPKTSPTSYSLLSTVKANKEHFTRKQIEGADNARRLQQQIGWPSNAHFKSIIASNQLQNCGITVDDVTRAQFIYGTPVPILQGKGTRSTPPSTKTLKVQIPAPILNFHKNVNITMDIFFVNRIPFLHTKSRDINFLSVQMLNTQHLREIIMGLQLVKRTYTNRGFNVQVMEGDPQFNKESLRQSLAPTTIESCAAEGHVGHIERSIRTVKERSRCYCQSLPYKWMPKIMTQAMLHTVIYWLNSFPSTDGVSKTMSPAAIVQGRGAPDFRRKRISFGAYALAYHQSSNTMERRRTPAIALQPANETGAYYFMSLITKRKFSAHDWDELPIDDEVINLVETFAKDEGRPKMINNKPLFEWAPGIPIADVEEVAEDDEEPVIVNDEEDDAEMINNEGHEDHNVVTDPDESTQEDEENIDTDDEDDISSSDNDNEGNELTSDDDNISYDDDDSETITDDDTQYDIVDEIENDPDISVDSEAVAHANDDGEEVRSAQRDENEETRSAAANDKVVIDAPARANTDYNNQRPIRSTAGQGVSRIKMKMGGKTYDNEGVQFMMKNLRKAECIDEDSYMQIATNVVFEQGERDKTVCLTQMPAKVGIDKFGERAIAAMVKEFKQLNDGPMPGKPVVGQINPDTLTVEEKRRALGAVNLIKEKRCGKIKGRTCANGSKQKRYLKEGETISSPTVSLEALITTLVIDAAEGRDVATFDVPGAYLHAEMPKDKKVLMKLQGDFVDIMCDVNPEFKQHVRMEKGKKVLYMLILRAIYGCIESALLWYNLFSETLTGMGFEINPYDRCVANKIIDGKQCTILWYVDDNKVSHMDPKVNTDIIDKISEHFGDLTVVRGKVHDFLGMRITLNDDKTFSIEMKDQIQEAISMFGQFFNQTVSTPATRKLHYVDVNTKQLNEKMQEVFHSVTAKLLFISKRARPDIEPTVAYLCTRVAKSDHDDWEKLRRVLIFLQQTIDDVRKVGGKYGLNSLNTWIDASYAVHPDMKSQTGGCMSLGTGILHAKSGKQKLNTRSTTESEIVGVSDYFPYTIWEVNFMEAQGYKLKKNLVHQDNESAIRIEKNGRNSCTGNSRHVDIRYYFIKDRVDKGECEILYCPTWAMLADYFTKPLQGKLFHQLRAIIMGWVDLDTLQASATEERVENKGAVLKLGDKHATNEERARSESVPSQKEQNSKR